MMIIIKMIKRGRYADPLFHLNYQNITHLLLNDPGIKDLQLGDQRVVEEQDNEHEHERGFQLLHPGMVQAA